MARSILVGSTLLAATLSGFAARAQSSEKVVVLDFVTPGIEAERAKAINASLVGIVSSELTGLGRAVLSAADVQAMLSYEKQKDLLGCEDNTSCLAEIGGALGADLLLAGTLSKLGDTFNISMTLVDIRGSTVRRRFQGSAGGEDALAATVRRGVGELFAEVVQISGRGTLFVRTEPPGARVLLDGKDVGLAPITVDDVDAGEHRVVVELGGQTAKLLVRVLPDAVERVTLELRATPVRVKFLSTPPEASVWLDGSLRGTTPVVLDDVPAGEHALTLRRDGFLDHHASLLLSAEQFEASGRTPLKVEAALRERIRILPFAAVLAVGGLYDLRYRRGVASHAELTARIGDRVELGLGTGWPLLSVLVARVHVLRFEGVALGVVGRAAAIPRRPANDVELAFISGATFDVRFVSLPVGDLGLRAEMLLSRDARLGAWTVPAWVSIYWSNA